MTLSKNENEFLAWYFIQTGRRNFGDIKGQDQYAAIEEWEKLTGKQITEKFFLSVLVIHDRQKNND